MSSPAVLITGFNGGLGRSLCEKFRENGYRVLGIDRRASVEPASSEITAIYQDLDLIVDNTTAADEFRDQVMAILSDQDLYLSCLVNNAAVQILGSADKLTLPDFRASLRTNLELPLCLILLFKKELERAGGSIINIGSIHSNLTKPGFISYATSKGGLESMTRALAVDFAGRIRVNCIKPAAIRTPMLIDGFGENPEALLELEQHHPSGRIGEPGEVGELAVFLASDRCGFINGATVGIDGAISSRLHDPV